MAVDGDEAVAVAGVVAVVVAVVVFAVVVTTALLASSFCVCIQLLVHLSFFQRPFWQVLKNCEIETTK